MASRRSAVGPTGPVASRTVRRTLLQLAALAFVAGAVLVACTAGAGADGDTIKACQRWKDIRDRGAELESKGDVAAIADEAQDEEVREAANQLAQSLALNLQSALWPSRAVALDRACSDALSPEAGS